MRKAAHVRKNLAMILYYFASTSEYRMIANLFGVSKTFLCNSREKNGPGFPMCAGAIGGVQIAIIAPKENHTDCVNRKGYHSVVMQAVVDCN